LGFATIVYEVPFILIYIASYSLDPRQMFFAFRGYAYLSLIPAIFTFIFFFHHDLNLRYITSPLAKLFINPNSIKLYLSDTSHYLWNGKPITLNLNPNVTAGLLGIIAILAWGLAYLFQYKPFKYIATFLWFSVFLAGSTAASLLNILIPIAGLWYYFCQHLRHPKWINRTSILISIVSILTGLLITTYTHPALHHFILNKLLSRILLWKVTGTFASTHWLTGIGFGGWDSYYSDFIKNAASKHYQAGLPPHNSIIQLFSESGIFALMFAILFIILLIKNIFSYIRQVNKSEKIFGICLLAAFAWMFIQGLGENWRLLGDIRVQPLLATCYGMMMARLKSNQGKF